MIGWKQKHGIWTFVSSLLFFLCAHVYRFTQLAYTDDSVEILQNSNRNWQISLGRWLQVFYWRLRGNIVVPYIIGLFAFLFFFGAIYLIIELLELRSPISVALVCMLLGCNATLTFANATYISWTDVYMLSFFLACASVYVTFRIPYGFFGGALLICASLALYQSYFQVAALLFLICMAKKLLQSGDNKQVLYLGFRALAALFFGLILYDLSLRLVEWKTGIARSTGYNGVGRVGGYILAKIPSLLLQTWIYPFQSMMKPETNLPKATTLCYILLIILSGYFVAEIIKKKQIEKRAVFFFILLVTLFPLGMNSVYFLSHGLSHSLMIYSFFLFFTFPIMLMDYSGTVGIRWQLGIRKAVVCLVSVIFLNNFVYANQMYARRDLEFWSTYSLMTRVIDRAEQVPEYQSGNTPVAIIGTLYNSPLSMERPGFGHLNGNSAHMNNNYFSTTGESFYPSYFWEVLGYPFNLVDEYSRGMIAAKTEVRNMPTFPEIGCCQIIDGVLVVKIGEVYRGP